MFRKITFATALMLLTAAGLHADEPQRSVVIELFTSQGCSSCPPADALLKELAASDAGVIALSFHVNYWDRLGWKDTYSSEANTDRQKAYEVALHQRNLFTPQMVVNGMASAVGSNPAQVKDAVEKAMEVPFPAELTLIPATNTAPLSVHIVTKNPAPLAVPAQIWKIQFDRTAQTPVGAGENRGRVLESINNVKSMTSLGLWQPGKDVTIPLGPVSAEGVAVIVQMAGQGPVLGATQALK